MPRFFFRIHDGADYPDTQGTELSDWREAQVEAVRRAGTIIADTARQVKLGEDWSMEVTNETGLVLFRLDFHISSSAAVMGSDWRKDGPSSAGHAPQPPEYGLAEPDVITNFSGDRQTNAAIGSSARTRDSPPPRRPPAR